jgi:protein-S-isoprenylcysteine O-methyltransferase Ste14
MLESAFVQSLIGLSFIFFGFNIVYIIRKRAKSKKGIVINQNNIRSGPDNQEYKFQKPRIISRLGLMIMNLFITLCFLNIIFYDWFKIIIPRIFPANIFFQFIGFSIVLIGNVILFFAYRELGTAWVYPIGGGKKLKGIVDTGIYSKIRHPIYLSFNIFSIGFNLILLDWVLLILYILGGFGLYLLAIDEEKILLKSFKEEYLEYIKKTGRFLPRIS